MSRERINSIHKGYKDQKDSVIVSVYCTWSRVMNQEFSWIYNDLSEKEYEK